MGTALLSFCPRNRSAGVRVRRASPDQAPEAPGYDKGVCFSRLSVHSIRWRPPAPAPAPGWRWKQSRRSEWRARRSSSWAGTKLDYVTDLHAGEKGPEDVPGERGPG